MTIFGQVWLVLLSISILMIGRGISGTYLGVRAEIESFSITWNSLIQSMTYLGFLIGSIWTPRIIQKVGHIRVYAVWATLCSVSPLLQAQFINPGVWAATQIIYGFGLSGIYIVSEGWLHEASDNKSRGKIFGTYSMIMVAITSFSPLLIGPISPSGVGLFLLMSIMSSLAFVPVALGARWTPSFENVERLPFKVIWQRTPFGVVSMSLTAMASNTLFTMFFVYGLRSGFTLAQITTGYLFMGIGSIISTYPLGIISDKMDRRIIVVFSSLLASICILGMFQSNLQENTPVFFLLCAGIGGFIFPLYSLISCHINDRMRVEEIVPAGAWIVLISAVSGIIGVFAIGPLISIYGTDAFLIVILSLMLLTVVYGLHRMMIRREVTQDERSSFIAVSQIAGVTVEQDVLTNVRRKKKKKAKGAAGRKPVNKKAKSKARAKAKRLNKK